ncbi:hypothetical protein P43SY_004394 [Pythium insidiosum]|uniref:Uncharacterized protein n=1 Tax=Pythium insidiosum TaxID=114742 RepID=A0AAD5MAP1_PYTIN|nr:hypothetical protein P43SY_004394 [Pythium insidiosum]
MKVFATAVLALFALAAADQANTTEPVCTPDFCGPTEDCVLKQVQCIRAPCPPIRTCVPKQDVCKGYSCPDSQECVPKQVQCIRAPCPPLPSCVPQKPSPSCTKKCGPNQRCFFYESRQYCADVCTPKVCGPDKTCELQRVQCFAAPCPPIAVCK